MKTQSGSSVRVPTHPDVSPATHQSVVESLSRKLSVRTASLGKEAKRIERVGEDYRAALLKFLGGRKLKLLAEYCAGAERARAKAIRSLGSASRTPSALRKIAGQSRDASLAFLGEIGVDVDAFRTLQRRYSSPPVHPPSPKKASRPKHVPRGGWTNRFAPFDGWHTWYSVWLHGALLTDDNGVYLINDPAGGFVGHRALIYSDTNPSSDDGGSSSMYSGVGFWYTMRVAGLVEVQIFAQVAVNRHHIHLEDYFGFSDSAVSQDNLITLTTAGAPIGSETSEVVSSVVQSSWNDRDDLDWNISHYAPGDIRTVHLFSEAVYAAGTQVYVEIGSRSEMRVQLRRIGIDTSMEFRWFIKRVRIRSTGSA